MTDQRVALWYWRYGVVGVDLCEDEDDAVASAYYMHEAGEGSPEGIERPDGTFTRMRDWEAYQEYENRRSDEIDEQIRNRPPPPPRRTVVVPEHMWDRRKRRVTTVPADYPDWVGESE